MISVILVSIIFLLSVVWLFYRRGSKQKFDIPGVSASDPEHGNLDDIGRAGSLHEYLTQLHKNYGPIVSFYWGKIRVVSIASPEAFYDTRRLFDRPIPLFSSFEPLIGSNSIQYANGDLGRYRRKHHYDTALSPIDLRTHCFDIFKRVLIERMDTWKLNEGKPIALHNEMLCMAIQSIILAACGLNATTENARAFEKAYDKCWQEMEKQIQGQPMDSKREREFKESRNFLLEKVRDIIAERRQRLGDESKCFIDYLLDDDLTMATDEHICDEVITMIVGGFHTTGNLLTWTLYYLAKHQNYQERLYNELTQMYNTEIPSCEQIDKMSYLANIFNEALRVSVLAPWAARVSTDNDIVICGKNVPAGTPIIQALGVLLQDEKIWTNPHEFNPDRFNEENKKKIPALAFSPFGLSGKRICPGYRFAQYEASLFIAGIIRKYKVTLSDPESPVIPVHHLVTSPKDEIFVEFNQRKS